MIKISQPVWNRNVWFFAVRFYLRCSTIWLDSFVTMATYWVPDLPNIKGFSRQLWQSILMFANGTLCVWSSKHMNVSLSLWYHLMFFVLKITNRLKKSRWGLEKSELPWEQNFCSCWCVSFRTISLPSFNGLLGGVYDVISHLICIFYIFFKNRYHLN